MKSQSEACLDFEKPIASLEKKLHDLREISKQDGVDLSTEVGALEKKVSELIDTTFSSLSPWQRVQLSRHPNRPYTRDYIENLFPDFREMAGDRRFADDRAIMAGIASWPPAQPGSEKKSKKSTGSVMIIGHQKGRTTKQKMLRNFGMAKPEGYRKAIRLATLAEQFRIPILTFIDTPGAYPGLETEERGQAQAIAEAIQHMFSLSVPILSVVIGEGGSGGALAIGVANRVLMQEYSTYSVISPEGCASILWSDSRLAEKASESLRMSPTDLKKLEVIDAVIPEPKGGAHRDWEDAFEKMRKSLIENMNEIMKTNWIKKPGGSTNGKNKSASATSIDKLRSERIKKFRAMGNLALGKTKKTR